MIKFSIIVPVYNVEDYIDECFESIINQTYKDFEVICVNDGSTDNSLEILNKYAAKDSRFKVISQENQGPGVARNNALDLARGKYIVFVDPDDYVSLNMLETLNKKFEETNAEIIHFNHLTVNKIKNKERATRFHLTAKLFGENIQPDSFYNWHTLKSSNRINNMPIGVWNKGYNAEYIKKNNIRFATNKQGEDNIFSIKAALLTEKIYYIDEILYFYRYRVGSLVNRTSIDNFCVFENIELVKEFLIENNLFENYSTDFEKNKVSSFAGHYPGIPEEYQEQYKEECRKRLNPEDYKLFLKKLKGSLSIWQKIFCIKNKRILGKKRKILVIFGFQFVFNK